MGLSVLLRPILIVFLCLLLGQVIVDGFGLPLPASIIGLLLLFLALQLGIVKIGMMQQLAKIMLDHLVLLVIPACISIMQYLDVIADDLWILLTATIISTLLVLISTAKSYEWLRRRQKHSLKGSK